MSTDQNDYQGGHTPLTPPPASVPAQPTASVTPPSAPSGPTGSGARSGGVTAIAIITAVVGGIALVGTAGTAAIAATSNISVASNAGGDTVQGIDVDGIESLTVDADASSLRVEFGDVDQAELAISNRRGPDWTIERDGDELVVRSPDNRWDWWFGDWGGRGEVAVLTLPESLRADAIDADLTLDAGGLDVVGDFGALDIDVSAGALDVEGSATALAVDMSAGRADIVLADVDDASLSVSAGDLTVELTGTAPTRTTVEVSAGSVDLTVPDVAYDITQSVDAGSLDARVEQSASARRSIEVSLSAGGVTIRPGR
ncbi:hypothetical protein ACIQTT_10735 [Microbacterium sp. NPDC090225]|uniref:hypothetical protein n=1 Tax=Microbacterium sp. NPDC090225 TaxID=3364207 RepID=UPI003812316F